MNGLKHYYSSISTVGELRLNHCHLKCLPCQVLEALSDRSHCLTAKFSRDMCRNDRCSKKCGHSWKLM